jgi:hypothetical protein
MKKFYIGMTCLSILVMGSGYAYAATDPVSVPEPSTIILIGSGLLGLYVFKKKFKK